MRLMLWVSQNRPSGDLSGMQDEDIELAVDWTGAEGAFCDSLRLVGFMDGGPCESKIHDWAQHNPWAAGFESRSEVGKYAALCKQYGREKAAEMMPGYTPRTAKECDPHADGMRTAEIRTTPIPLPSPSPLPSPTPSKKKPVAQGAPVRPDEITERTWDDWLQLRKTKRAPVTETVLAEAKREASKAGLPLERFFTIWCARGSQGLQADWLKPNELGQRSAANGTAVPKTFGGQDYSIGFRGEKIA